MTHVFLHEQIVPERLVMTWMMQIIGEACTRCEDLWIEPLTCLLGISKLRFTHLMSPEICSPRLHLLSRTGTMAQGEVKKASKSSSSKNKK